MDDSRGLAVGPTTLWGRLLEVDADASGALLGLRGGELFTAAVTEEIIGEIRERNLIGKDIGLVGLATWRMDDWGMESFEATDLADYRPGEVSLTEAFRLLAEASRGRWDGVDAAQYVSDLRYEDA